MPQKSITIWTVTDNRPGHLKQAEALIAGLQHFRSCQNTEFSVNGGLLHRLRTSHATARRLIKQSQRPDLLLGVGQATHLPLLSLQRSYGGKTVVLMKPSLPNRLFDYVLIPQHDQPKTSDRVWATEGALCLSPRQPKKPDTGLFLIGGPDRRFSWNEADLIARISAICQATPETTWTLTTSRRTPVQFLGRIPQKHNLTSVAHDQCQPDWLTGTLNHTETAWVTPDSVSMIYEALSAGTRVGLLQFGVSKPNKLSQNLERLSEQGDITIYDAWVPGTPLALPHKRYEENLRCAARLLQQQGWLDTADQSTREPT
ncbi:MAG: mitochondrial fission ELM1 family protein [Gammaproteobacteria bacterium]|nr:mitochondrial fission ELM1 family protein [Gammaproteobacteria bacterium]